MNKLDGKSLPQMLKPLGGEATQKWVDRLARAECPALTMRRARREDESGASHDPIVWTQAFGSNVMDVEGNVYVDLIAGFGALSIGHRHPKVIEAAQKQSEQLVHGLGDVYPSDIKIQLLEKLANISPFDGARVMLGLNGSDAVAAALKTAALHTKKPGVLAFENGYHGLFYGPLAVSEYKDSFREPFKKQLNPFIAFSPWPSEQSDVQSAIERVIQTWDAADFEIGAVLFEPIQGRGGLYIPPPSFLRSLCQVAHERDAIVIADEILCGLERCGAVWLSEEWGIDMDVLCTGKSLGGGYPISACIGKYEVMQAWGDPNQEAIHTATFQGHPISCATALAVLDAMEKESLSVQVADMEQWFLKELAQLKKKHPQIQSIRGKGLMWGIEFSSGSLTLKLVRQLLEHGYLVLAAGKDAKVLQVLPPLNIREELLRGFVETLDHLLKPN